MDTVIGIRGHDFAMVATDRYACSSILRYKDDENKILTVDRDKLLALSGEVGDRVQFGEYIRKNVHLYRIRSGLTLNCSAMAEFTRNELAYFLRRSPYQVNAMIAGCDEEGKARLFWIDYLASMVPLTKGAHGYAAYLVEGLLDRFWKENMSQEEGLEVLKKCKFELSKRFIASQAEFLVKVVDKNGVRDIIL